MNWKEAPIGKFWWLVGYTEAHNYDWRPGQAVFNVLAFVRPDLSERIRATEYDAFRVLDSQDPLMDKMCKWIEEHWNE